MRYYLLVTFFKPVPEGTVEREDQIIYRRQRARLNFNKDIVCIHEPYFFQRRNPRWATSEVDGRKHNSQGPSEFFIFYIRDGKRNGKAGGEKELRNHWSFFLTWKRYVSAYAWHWDQVCSSFWTRWDWLELQRWDAGTYSMKYSRLNISRTRTSRFQSLQYTIRCLAEGRTGYASFARPGWLRRIWQCSAWSLPEWY